MICFVPISDEDGDVAGGIGEGDRDSRAAEDPDAAETAGGLMEIKRREVEEASDLVLHLENVGEVPPRRDWACRSVHTIFVRVPPLLNATPAFYEIYIYFNKNL